MGKFDKLKSAKQRIVAVESDSSEQTKKAEQLWRNGGDAYTQVADAVARLKAMWQDFEPKYLSRPDQREDAMACKKAIDRADNILNPEV